MTEPTDTRPTVHEAMAAILDELPAIGKDQHNAGQNFNFRGIDDVLAALNPLLGKHGVFFVPNVVERVVAKRETRNGGLMYEVNLHVRYTFYGPRGDSVFASGWGEGTDSGDKATNKAMTAAMKYVLGQVFAIATRDTEDSDRSQPEETVAPPELASEEEIDALRTRIADLDADHKALLRREWIEKDLPRNSRGPVLKSLTAEQEPVARALVSEIEKLGAAMPKGTDPNEGPGTEPFTEEK